MRKKVVLNRCRNGGVLYGVLYGVRFMVFMVFQYFGADIVPFELVFAPIDS